jgi:hypothetical protein
VDDLVGIFGKAWQQDSPSWQQVAPKSRQDAAKMASLVTFDVLLKRFLSNILKLDVSRMQRNWKSLSP